MRRDEQTMTACPEPARLIHLLSKLLQRHGFTYPGLARNQHESALPLASLARVLMQRGQLAFPLDQPHPLILRRVDVYDDPVDQLSERLDSPTLSECRS